MKTLQELFMESAGRPVDIDGVRIIQMDSLAISPRAVVEITFLGDAYHANNAVVLAVPKNGRILLSDESSAEAVAIWDDPPLPRVVCHLVESPNEVLQVYNKYRIFHSEDWCTEDSFTGNAGIVVEINSVNSRTYRCSNSLGPFSPKDLVFELSCRPQP